MATFIVPGRALITGYQAGLVPGEGLFNLLDDVEGQGQPSAYYIPLHGIQFSDAFVQIPLIGITQIGGLTGDGILFDITITDIDCTTATIGVTVDVP